MNRDWRQWMRWIGRFLLFLILRAFEGIGWLIINIGLQIWWWVRRNCFGTFRSTCITLGIVAIVTMRYSPQQAGPLAGQLLAIGILLFSIGIMLSPLQALLFGKKKKRKK